jgi:diketogulonate reductase-like aldo/keto reductase
MTDQQIRLHFGELNADETRLASAIVGWHEAREAKLRAAADGLAEALGICTFKEWFASDLTGRVTVSLDADQVRAALAAYQATKPS